MKSQLASYEEMISSRKQELESCDGLDIYVDQLIQPLLDANSSFKFKN